MECKTLNIMPYYWSYFIQMGSFHFISVSDSLSYVHFKTNVSIDTNTMWMIETIGYNYRNAQNIRAGICFHTSNGMIYSPGAENIYPGLNPEAIYASSDRYVVLRYKVPSDFYYVGFVMNAYKTGPYTAEDYFSISTYSINNNSGTGTY
jgi:hypothetical protein